MQASADPLLAVTAEAYFLYCFKRELGVHYFKPLVGTPCWLV